MQRTIGAEVPASAAPSLAVRRISAEHITLTLLVAASAIAGVCLAWAPVKFLVGHAMYDDGFYYLQIARNIVHHGHGVSADGEVWTNGFHPLWMLILLPVYALPLDADNSLHVALSVSALIVSGSGVLLYMTAKRLRLSPIASLACVAFYLLNPVVLFMSVDGLETGVNLAAFIAFLYAYIVARQEPTGRHQLVASAAAGVLVLSRTDYGIVAALMLAALLARDRSVRAALRLSLPSIAVTAPWFIWNFVVFGSVLQGSADATPYVKHHQGIWATAPLWRVGLASLLKFILFTLRLLVIWLGQAGPLTLLGLPLFVAIVVATIAIAKSRYRIAGSLELLAFPAVGLVALLVVHGAIRWFVQEWYLMPVFALFALVIGTAVDVLRTATTRQLRIAMMLILLSVVMAGQMATRIGSERHPEFVSILAASRWVGANTSSSTRVGAFNSGILSYYSGRTTVNLDGVVNPDASNAIRQRRITEYVHEERIDLIVDFPRFIDHENASFFGSPLHLDVLRTFSWHGTDRILGPDTVYAVDQSAPG